MKKNEEVEVKTKKANFINHFLPGPSFSLTVGQWVKFSVDDRVFLAIDYDQLIGSYFLLDSKGEISNYLPRLSALSIKNRHLDLCDAKATIFPIEEVVAIYGQKQVGKVYKQANCDNFKEHYNKWLAIEATLNSDHEPGYQFKI